MKQHAHFIGVGGVGMGTLAAILLSKGYKVSGSDVKESQLTRRLAAAGAKIFIGHKSSQIKQPDFVVYSSAIGKDNPEILEAKRKKIPLKKRARLLAQLLNKETGITVAGAHGKTTTTAMIAQILFTAGLNPSTMVGGVIQESSRNAHLGDGKYFVAEVDESDGSFLLFRPLFSVVTNIDVEHLDYYHSWENIKKSYQRFISQTKKNGCVFIYGEDPVLKKMTTPSGVRRVTFGKAKSNDVQARDIVLNGYAGSFECWVKNKYLGRVELNVPGEHNIRNALAALAAGLELGIAWKSIQLGLKEYRAVERRFQLKALVLCQTNYLTPPPREYSAENLSDNALVGDMMVVDDYGHHPTEIISTLQAARSFGNRRLVVVFQPHRYSRTKFLLNEFAQSLVLSDYLILTDIYAAGEQPIAGVNSKELLNRIQEINKIPAVYSRKEDICAHLLMIIRPGDLILFLGAGDITYVGDEFVKRLKSDKNLSSPTYFHASSTEVFL